jgi:hypothetical protein
MCLPLGQRVKGKAVSGKQGQLKRDSEGEDKVVAVWSNLSSSLPPRDSALKTTHRHSGLYFIDVAGIPQSACPHNMAARIQATLRSQSVSADALDPRCTEP